MKPQAASADIDLDQHREAPAQPGAAPRPDYRADSTDATLNV
jgi:hypothetical protein